jgi:hypothetical protein
VEKSLRIANNPSLLFSLLITNKQKVVVIEQKTLVLIKGFFPFLLLDIFLTKVFNGLEGHDKGKKFQWFGRTFGGHNLMRIKYLGI